jgi:plasmid stabilization system protein ParE
VEARGALNVRYTPRAENDLAKIIDYLTPLSPGGARNVAATLREAIQAVSVHPFSGRRTRRPAILVKIVPGYPYRIFYRLGEDSIEILHIRHAS